MNLDLTATLLLLFSFSCDTVLNALEIEGQTTGGMQFKGKFVSLSQDILQMTAIAEENPSPVGIPLSVIECVSFDILSTSDPETSSRLETLFPVLAYCDKSTLSSLLKWIQSMAETGRWAQAYLWSSRVLKSTKDPDIHLEAAFVEARSLLEMGLYNRLEARLESLNATIEPLEAPPLLSELNARLCRWKGDAERARFWDELPGLQIPVRSGGKTLTDTQN